MNKNRGLLISILIAYIALIVVLTLMIVPSATQIIGERLFRYASFETIVMIIAVLITFLAFLITLLFSVVKRKSVVADEIVSTKRIDEERSYLERQINELNSKLVSTDKRLMEAYHLILSSQSKIKDRSGRISNTAFLNGFGIDPDEVEIQKDLTFILTPFHDDFKATYDVVCKVCQDMKLKPMRGDEEYIARDILKHVINQVVRSRLVIAILDGRNPNVFYELGIVHSLNKPTILLANINTSVPFDLQNQYLILYENEADLRMKLKNAILNILTLS